ncbi:MAG: D-ribitol-5-phosphate cytidylyltransferase [Oscillospiraceae bacterium]|nr:D-ribitol-5-phosphate cytidylyltransferase [Oscillospiraceae bacterium]
MIYGAVLAGGIGKRVERYSIPKQFITIGGIPIIVLTLQQFLKNKRLDIIYVAVHKDWIVYAEKLFNNSFSKEELSRVRIVSGGKERLDSFTNIMDDIIERTGLNGDDVLICHDSVRPFVRQQMIDDCISATMEEKLALTVVPVTDTIHTAYVDEAFLDGTLDRNGLYNGQTPSGFNLKLLHDSVTQFSDEEKKRVTGTTQLMLKLGYKIKIVNGHTSNFKITTDNDLDVADRVMRSVSKTRGTQLLDCTLRDGGIVIGFDFGLERMQKIKSCLENAGVEYIECGYINEKTGSKEGRTCFDNEQSIKDTLLKTGKKPGVTYVAMIDYGTFDLNKLQPADENGIDGIRYAFHKENWHESIAAAKTIIEKGYDLYIQPMVSVRYSDEEFRELISCCNNELPEAKAFYIVDSFGQMDNMMLLHKLEIADRYVSDTMKIGFHAHNNRQMAFSNACAMINYPAKHELMLDASIMGMGKGAGNLCTELVMPVLIAEGSSYSTVEIYDEISSYFSEVIKTNPWGYCLDYYLSSLYGCTPSYISIFVKDKRVTTDILVDLLKNMPAEKKAACDKSFAAEYLKEFFGEL